MFAPASSAALCDFRFRCVDRNEDVDLSAQFLDHGNDPPQLLFRRNRLGARTRRFTAHIDNVRALRCHLHAVRNGRFHIQELAAVGKRIGRDIQHAHDHPTPRNIDGASPDFPKPPTHQV